jgi:hypothetical protein
MKLTPAPILLLRLAVAIFFLYLGYTKMSNGWLTSTDRLEKSLLSFEHNAPPASRWTSNTSAYQALTSGPSSSLSVRPL